MDSSIVEEFYYKYKKEVYVYIFSLCKNKELAEDIMQEAFVKSLLSLNKKEGNIRGWLLKVSRNILIDHIRKDKFLSNMDLDNVQIENGEDSLIDRLITKEKNRKLYEAILLLNQTQREVLILFYFLKFSQREIGEILNMSEGAVRTVIYRGRLSLRKHLEGEV